MSVEDRLWGRVIEEPSGCWVFTGYVNSAGYGRLRDEHGRSRLAHVIAYELVVGVVPRGLKVGHVCGREACVNPAHLVAGTVREHTLRGDTIAARNAAKTHCPRGHAYDARNTYLYRSRRGRHRMCRTCKGLRPA